MFILVAAKPRLVKKQSPDVRTGSADEQERFVCAYMVFKWETNLFGSEVRIQPVHRVSSAVWRFYVRLCTFTVWRVGIDWGVCLPRSPAFLELQMLFIRNAKKVKAEMLLSSQGKSVTRY